MSRITTYKCDRCKKSSETNKDLDLERVRVVWGDYSGAGSYKQEHSAEWCKPCRIETGIENPNHDKAVAPIIPPPTLDDLIREICREEIDAARG